VRTALVGVLALITLLLSVRDMARNLDGDVPQLAAIFGVKSEPLPAISSQFSEKVPLSDAQFAELREFAERHPLDARVYSIAGASAALREDASATPLMRQAAALNPRNRAATTWLFLDALQRNEAEEATFLLLRKMALGPDDPANITILVQLTRLPEVRAILKPRLADFRWRSQYLESLSASDLDRSIVYDMVEDAPAAVGAVDFSDRSKFLQGLIASGEYERAYLAWIRWRSREELEGIDYLYDGDFRKLGGAPPFNWALATKGAGSAAIEPGAGLSVTYNGRARAELASETLLIEPGTYRFSSVSRVNSSSRMFEAGSKTALTFRILCLPEGREIGRISLPESSEMVRVDSSPFEVGGDCRAQRVVLVGEPGDFPVRTSGTIRAVSIEAVR